MANDGDLKIDLDAIDDSKNKKDDKAATNGAQKSKADEVTVIAADDPAKAGEKDALAPEAGLEKLKKQLDEERAGRLAAERRAQEAADAEVRAKTEVQTSQLDLVVNAIAQVTQASDALEQKYTEAMTAQDFVAVAKIQREMSKNEARLLQLEQGKVALEKAPKPTARPAIDPVEHFVSTLSARSAAWVRAHPEFVRDADKNRQMLAAHELAMGRRLAPDTDEYFASIEKTLDLAPKLADSNADDSKPDTLDPMKDTAKETAGRKAAPAAAPVTRSGNGSGNRSNVVTLSAAEVEAAAMNGISPEEYARNKQALKREGRLN